MNFIIFTAVFFFYGFICYKIGRILAWKEAYEVIKDIEILVEKLRKSYTQGIK